MVAFIIMYEAFEFLVASRQELTHKRRFGALFVRTRPLRDLGCISDYITHV